MGPYQAHRHSYLPFVTEGPISTPESYSWGPIIRSEFVNLLKWDKSPKLRSYSPRHRLAHTETVHRLHSVIQIRLCGESCWIIAVSLSSEAWTLGCCSTIAKIDVSNKASALAQTSFLS